MIRARRGQTMVEFALVSVVLLGLLFVVIDLGRAGFAQHNLDGGMGDLAHGLATISGTNSSGDPTTYAPTPLDPASTLTTISHGQLITVSTAIRQAVAHAVGVSGGAILTSPLVMVSPTTLSNGQVIVSATPDLTRTTQLTVTATIVFKPIVGLFIGGMALHLQATETDIPLARTQQ